MKKISSVSLFVLFLLTPVYVVFGSTYQKTFNPIILDSYVGDSINGIELKWCGEGQVAGNLKLSLNKSVFVSKLVKEFPVNFSVARVSYEVPCISRWYNFNKIAIDKNFKPTFSVAFESDTFNAYNQYIEIGNRISLVESGIKQRVSVSNIERVQNAVRLLSPSIQVSDPGNSFIADNSSKLEVNWTYERIPTSNRNFDVYLTDFNGVAAISTHYPDGKYHLSVSDLTNPTYFTLYDELVGSAYCGRTYRLKVCYKNTCSLSDTFLIKKNTLNSDSTSTTMAAQPAVSRNVTITTATPTTSVIQTTSAAATVPVTSQQLIPNSTVSSPAVVASTVPVASVITAPVVAQLVVLSPKVGESYFVGGTIPIKWSVQGVPSGITVKATLLDSSSKATSFYKVSTVAAGGIDFVVPTGVVPGSYNLIVCALNGAYPECAKSGYFNILSQKSAIDLKIDQLASVLEAIKSILAAMEIQ